MNYLQLVQEGFPDTSKTFAPVTKLSSICAICAIATKLNLEVHQLDDKSAILSISHIHAMYVFVLTAMYHVPIHVYS